MSWITSLALVVLVADGPTAGPADVLTLRDGKVVLGQVVEGDRIGPWIDAELARLANQGDRGKTPLMLVHLARSEVKSVSKRSKTQGRMLRLAWTLHLPDPETMGIDSLTQSLEDRGYAPNADTPAPVDALLPLPVETDNHWLLRRAATELVNDPGGRLLRYQGMVMDEPAPGEAPPAGAALTSALSTIQSFLSDTPPPDPLPGQLNELGAKGRVGVAVTRMEMAGDFSNVAVESTLWVRVAGNRWMPAITKSSASRPDAMANDAGLAIGDDPQVKAAFGAVEALGFGQVPAELKQKALGMGAATQKALADARGRFTEELNAVALSLESPGERPSTAPKP